MPDLLEFKYIDKVGVELEGGWERRPPDTEVYGDGSVTVRATHVGEVASQPVESFNNLKDFLLRNYPSAVNASCGLHVHISLKNKYHYSLLMDRRFYNHYRKHMERMVERIKAKFPGAERALKERLAGSNSYCRPLEGDDAVVQASIRCKDSVRYRHLNFCFLLHGTVESRLFPMFHDAGLAVAAVKDYLIFVEDYLEKQLTKPKRGVVIDKNVTTEPKVVRLK